MAKNSLFIENALILSKLDEFIAKIEYEKTKITANLNEIEAKNESLSSLKKELDFLKETNLKLTKENNRLENLIKNGNRNKEEDFLFPEKIAKIVNLIEEEGKSRVGVWNELIETLINEIDETINLLKNK